MRGPKKQKIISGNRTKRARGFSFIEVAFTCFFVIACSVFGLDIWFLLTAAPLNDIACRDGARAAAQAKDAQTALNMALTAIEAHTKEGTAFISPPKLDTTKFLFQDYGMSSPNFSTPPTVQPANTPAYVQVSTFCVVKPIVPFNFFGLIGSTAQITYRQTYTFPIVKTKLGT
jgi:hypothetical protein